MKKTIYVFVFLLLTKVCFAAGGSSSSNGNEANLYKEAKSFIVRAKKLEKKDKVEKALKLRDFSDKNRKESPLLFIKGAVLVDTTNLTLKQMEGKIVKLVRMKIKQKIDGNI